MKNKKLLNIFILLLSLLTLIADILLFAFLPYKADTNQFLIVLFWIFNSLTLVSLVISILLTLISLFMDDYVASKMVETFVLVAFIMSFINVLIFAMSKQTLSFAYILVCVLAFLTSSISQILRLIASFKDWGKNFKALVKTHKPVTIINAVENADDDMIMVDGGRIEQEKEKQNKRKNKENDLSKIGLDDKENLDNLEMENDLESKNDAKTNLFNTIKKD